ncbi:MAG: hypothetical protein HYX78_04960, partial [Armatimonadetes bacterium]|nr:hypothetical protein [Armatimonadota bacterium]
MFAKGIMGNLVVVLGIVALLLAPGAEVLADLTNWTLLITATDINGYYSAGSTRLGWLSGFTNGVDFLEEDAPPASPAPGMSIGTVVAWPSSTVLSTFDYRLSISSGGQTPMTYLLSVYCQNNSGPGLIDPIRIKITEPSPTRAFPYELGPLVIDYTPDQENWTQVVYTEQNPLPSEGLIFEIEGKSSYSYD